MGRTERIDKEELKKSSCALSSVLCTSLPNAHSDALFEANIDRPPLQPLEATTNKEPEKYKKLTGDLRVWCFWGLGV